MIRARPLPRASTVLLPDLAGPGMTHAQPDADRDSRLLAPIASSIWTISLRFPEIDVAFIAHLDVERARAQEREYGVSESGSGDELISRADIRARQQPHDPRPRTSPCHARRLRGRQARSEVEKPPRPRPRADDRPREATLGLRSRFRRRTLSACRSTDRAQTRSRTDGSEPADALGDKCNPPPAGSVATEPEFPVPDRGRNRC